ncbi:patatin-like phospholipase RssA [Thiobacillus sp. 65-1402]|uniref:patatin-like phospholipase RssA n=1 Tax=Thiobacillus sp. 65-1402 TaxID=1895861 RepID=UPI0009604D12|nr:patatin-like phospholipase RssA [Thiobacillus sp. 65-1402]OJW99885.1 MAG: patatin [Thiobacillus sp. 65-1402]
MSPRIGLALGGGSARGWAHIGVIRALADAGIEPDLVCGTSIGALVGAAYVGGELDRLEAWVRSLRVQTVVSFLDFSLGGGLIKGDKLIEFFRSHFVDRDIRELARPFGAVATDLQRGREVWLREGGVSDAVRASIALPGLFTPAQRDGSWLVDGGLVNPVPVSLCRAMGADLVIAVDLNADLLGRHLKPRPAAAARKRAPANPENLTDSVMARIQTGMSQLGLNSGNGPRPPAMLDVLASSINIMQVLITRSRLAGDPADVMVTPLLANLGLMEFHRADVAIDAGRRAMEAAIPQLNARLNGMNGA